ncbi:Ppx/GppA phosphatase family protein [Cohnella lubricantis]|uniref:Ppx/GppA family phosphatase n=1 Tax=Cohnella lubricantis TaxID=2163172 RepID=A0A841T7J4_9BACL|nr:Ppx/GppA phosphatase family protein [Cohnella lubricantis]MBB6676026.1 Ppx/GppA family phosphatase [Cohnella lubricantis]MBP2117961.1 exopolyphosphatase/guanosine-5'-triphosphate,3'-diphosphate pyrophosphatase [Cohnella lubricantis]
MKQFTQVTGMIDIGSNTVRLAVYQVLGKGAYRVVDQARWPARLSEKLTSEGLLPLEAIDELAEVLRHFRRICKMNGASRTRAVATAAIRQAVNGRQVLDRLRKLTGLEIELLSGDEEARFGSVAVLRTMGISDALLVDIGGGSTEISLVRGRRLVHGISIPFGCVNTASRHSLNSGPVTDHQMERMQEEMIGVMRSYPWIAENAHLPLIGLGGTTRALAKLCQRAQDYPYANLHGFELSETTLQETIARLASLNLDKRRKVPGLSKDRADIIVPGLAILRAIVGHSSSSKIVVCGAGLRDGLFYETCMPEEEPLPEDQVLEESIRNLTALYPTVPEEHLAQVNRLALKLFERLAPTAGLPADSRRLLSTASRLFKIGAVIDAGDFSDHTFYILMHAHWNGLSHREIVLAAGIASYRGANPLRRKLSPYRRILRDGDFTLAMKLGSLLQLAAALDRSESQAISSLEVSVRGHNKLRLSATASHTMPIERMEVDSIAKEFKKNWGFAPKLSVTATKEPIPQK